MFLSRNQNIPKNAFFWKKAVKLLQRWEFHLSLSLNHHYLGLCRRPRACYSFTGP